MIAPVMGKENQTRQGVSIDGSDIGKDSPSEGV